MKWLRNRFLLLPYFVLLIALVTVGCTSKEDPAETLDVSGNHSTGDLVMVTTDTSSDGYHYLNPQLSPDQTTILFSADWWAIPTVRDPGDATYVKNRQMIIIPDQVGVEPKLNLEEQGAKLIALQETSIPIAGSDFYFTDMVNMDKANPIWLDDTHILFSVNTERVGNRLFQADISNPDYCPINVLYMEPSDGMPSPPSWQHLEPNLESTNKRWLVFTRSGCVVPDSFETCTGVTLEVLDMNTSITNNGYDGVTYQLTNEYSRIESPKWSPDGTKIIFSGGLDVGGDMGSGTEIFTIDVDTLLLDNGTHPLDNNLNRLTYTSLPEGDPIAGVFNYGAVYSEDMNTVYFVSTRRAPTTTLHDRNIWTIPSDGRLEPQIYYFTRDDDVDPFIMPSGRILFSSALGFPTEMLTRLEEEAYQQWVVRNEEEELGLTEVEMRTLAADEIQNLTFFEGVMSHIYTFTK